MRSAIAIVILLLVAPIITIPASASGSPEMTVSMSDRFHLSHEQVHFTVVADNLTTGSIIELSWELFEGSMTNGNYLLNDSLTRTATGTSKSMSFQESVIIAFIQANVWIMMRME